MSHLGINYAISAAQKGFNVICYDSDIIKINNLIKNKISFYEPGLDILLKKNRKKIIFTTNIKIINKCHLVFLSQDVPTNYKNESNLVLINKLIKKTLLFLNKKACFVILSQVHPAFTRNIEWDKKKLYYQVETLVFGNALNRIFKAERIIFGSYNASFKINKYYENFLKKFKCPIIHLNYESAEIAKISINIFLISQVCTTNLLASVCEKIGAEWQSIIPALKSDERIGLNAYINPGLGLSGGNLERDLKTLISITRSYSIKDKILESFHHNSVVSKDWILKKINKIKINKQKDKIAILGLAYKENTDSIKNSTSIDLISKLKGHKITAFDPKIKSIKLNNLNFSIAKTLSEALEKAKILIIMNKSVEFKKLSSNLLKKKLIGRNVMDPYGVLKNLNLKKKNFNYEIIGN